MTKTASRTRYFLDIEPELRNSLKAAAALRGITMKEWLTEAIVAKLEDEIDTAKANASMSDNEGTLWLEDYLKLREKE